MYYQCCLNFKFFLKLEFNDIMNNMILICNEELNYFLKIRKIFLYFLKFVKIHLFILFLYQVYKSLCWFYNW